MRTPLSLDRFLTFIDAIVAIAVTLLILPLVEITSDLNEKTPIREAVLDEESLRKYVAFALSFIVIFRFWRVHHRLLEPIESYDSVLVTLTAAWSMTIVLLPYPTALIEVYEDDAFARGFYLITLVISSALLTALAIYLSFRPKLFKDEAHLESYGDRFAPSAATTILLALATVVALLFPRVNWGALLLLVFTGVVTRLIRNLRHRMTRRAHVS